MTAGITIAVRIDRLDVVAKARVANIDAAETREQLPVARVPRRNHAVEHIDAAGDGPDEIERSPDTHQVPGRADRHQRLDTLEHGEPLLFRLTDGEAADGVTVERDRFERLDRAPAQIRVYAALDDAEQRGVGAALPECIEGVAAAPGPAYGKLHRLPGDGMLDRILGTLVEHHDDIGIEPVLDLDRALGRQVDLGAVHG